MVLQLSRPARQALLHVTSCFPASAILATVDSCLACIPPRLTSKSYQFFLLHVSPCPLAPVPAIFVLGEFCIVLLSTASWTALWLSQSCLLSRYFYSAGFSEDKDPFLVIMSPISTLWYLAQGLAHMTCSGQLFRTVGRLVRGTGVGRGREREGEGRGERKRMNTGSLSGGAEVPGWQGICLAQSSLGIFESLRPSSSSFQAL